MAFEKNLSEFTAFIHQNNCKVSICFVISEITDTLPALTIDRELINFASKLNAEIYFDGLGGRMQR
jgi:hypothetical protein